MAASAAVYAAAKARFKTVCGFDDKPDACAAVDAMLDVYTAGPANWNPTVKFQPKDVVELIVGKLPHDAYAGGEVMKKNDAGKIIDCRNGSVLKVSMYDTYKGHRIVLMEIFLQILVHSLNPSSTSAVHRVAVFEGDCVGFYMEYFPYSLANFLEEKGAALTPTLLEAIVQGMDRLFVEKLSRQLRHGDCHAGNIMYLTRPTAATSEAELIAILREPRLIDFERSIVFDLFYTNAALRCDYDKLKMLVWILHFLESKCRRLLRKSEAVPDEFARCVSFVLAHFPPHILQFFVTHRERIGETDYPVHDPAATCLLTEKLVAMHAPGQDTFPLAQSAFATFGMWSMYTGFPTDEATFLALRPASEVITAAFATNARLRKTRRRRASASRRRRASTKRRR